jgi:hypothetical protein
LVRCEGDMEKDQGVVVRVEHTLQGLEEGNEELVLFPGLADQTASEDFKRLKLCWVHH